MKKKGDNWKKFKNLENDILKVLNKKNKTIYQIKSELDKNKVKTSWITIKNYLSSLHKKDKVNKNILGRYNFYSKG